MRDSPAKRFLIAPSILSADFAELGQQVKTAEAAGGDWIHVDIMDGHFVPNTSMGRLAVEACRRVTQLPLDVHLMVKEPERFVEIYAKAGADHLSVHIESTPNIHRLIQTIHQLDCKAGIVINPGTSPLTLEPILHMVHLVLVMTVNPGYGGQEFIPETLPKIRQVRQMLDQINPEALIQVDGGISKSTVPLVIEAGAQIFVAGNAIFNHPDGISSGIQAIKSCFPV
jgi:ribulose-phosphate 3-epimerase